MRVNLNKETKKQPITTKEREISSQNEVKILNLAVHLEKLTAQLSDVKGVSTEKLRNYEIKRGKNIYFPEIDEVLGIEAFTYGFNAPCE
ncbi:6729_t:CDS:2 [Funneliformis geosporum]|uniref:17490_t:CDS:1 n=1 Tax=Funneliformis geosporum TaxID=1117311 RepID=A0A9W4WSS2_9GLOM|nr:17490_t:CDS:2 [Funneliformis geosporum]CAI2173379.1 6729_t:CDS:2 [Funneliformis geosporum]